MIVSSSLLPGTTVRADAVDYAPGVTVGTSIAAATPPEGLHLNKTLTRNLDGSFKVTLEAYASGNVTVTTTQQRVPTDIIMVLDTSGSMADPLGSTTKLAALKSAASTFVSAVANDGETHSVDHRIAIVSFSEAAYNLTSGFLNAHDDESSLLGTIDSLSASDGTQPDTGMSLAKDILESDSTSRTGRNRVVILFTDGKPTGYYFWHGQWHEYFDTDSATRAISISKELKASVSSDGYGCSVYSIAVLEGANPSADFSHSYYNPDDDTKKTNRFLHYVSSNYPNATDLETGGTGGNQSGGYYKVASDAASLSSIFTDISTDITTGGTQVTLDETAVVKDVLSPYFTLPEGTDASNIAVYTQMYQGNSIWAARTALAAAAVTVSGQAVRVSNFSYKDNYVADVVTNGTITGGTGKKLIIEIPVLFNRSSTFGGAGIPSNTVESGIYDSTGLMAGQFAIPTVNAPIVYDFAAQDQSIRLSQNADYSQLFRFLTSYIPDGSNNAHVNIVYTVKDGSTTLGTYSIPAGQNAAAFNPAWWSGLQTSRLTDCHTYMVYCAVSSAAPGISACNISKNASVHVFIPQITCADTSVYLGESINLTDYLASHTAVQWIDRNAAHTASTPSGAAPAITYSIAPSAFLTPFQDAEVNLGIQMNGSYWTDYVSFVRSPCMDCQYAGDTHLGSADKPEFVVHVKTCSLTVTKTGAQMIDEYQTFLFTVTGPAGRTYQVAIQGNGSQTIVGLPVGSYTVAEQSNWSWRYAPASVSQTATLSAGTHDASLTFSNSRNNGKWLSGDSFAINRFAPVGVN